MLLDHGAMATRMLTAVPACGRRYPDGAPLPALLEVSRKKDLDRRAEIERVRQERDLQDLGHLPKSPRVVARRVAPGVTPPLPLFAIADAEMASGVFPDLERALANPGTEVDEALTPR